MKRQKTALVPAPSKKTKQVTVIGGESHCWLLQSASCTLYNIPVPNICWWDFRETFTFSAFDKAMLR